MQRRLSLNVSLSLLRKRNKEKKLRFPNTLLTCYSWYKNHAYREKVFNGAFLQYYDLFTCDSSTLSTSCLSHSENN